MSDHGFGGVELDETEHLTSGERRTSREYEMVSQIVFSRWQYLVTITALGCINK
jgi:hypothetical protein